MFDPHPQRHESTRRRCDSCDSRDFGTLAEAGIATIAEIATPLDRICVTSDPSPRLMDWHGPNCAHLPPCDSRDSAILRGRQ